MPWTVGRREKGDIEVTFDDQNTDTALTIESTSSLEKLYGKKIYAQIEQVAKSLGTKVGRISAVDDGALPYVITARVEAAIRLAKEGNDER